MIIVCKSYKYILQQETLYNIDIKVFIYGILNSDCPLCKEYKEYELLTIEPETF